MGVVGESDHDIGTGAKEFAMELAQRVRKIEDDFGDIRTGFDVSPPFEFEDVAFGADDNIRLQSFEEAAAAPSRHGLSQTAGDRTGKYPRAGCRPVPAPTGSGRS